MTPNSTANTPDEITGEVYSPSSTEGSGSETPNSDANQTSVDSSSAQTEAERASAGQEREVTFGQEILENSDQVQQELVALAEANAALKAQLEDITGQYRRLGADFENFRKRTQKEKEEQEVNIKCSTLKQLLPAIDNFERARSQIQPQTEGEMKIHKSYQGVYKLMVDGLKQMGVSVMRPEGEPFDPNLHEAVMREPTDAYPEGTVIEDLMRGYLFGDRVLRHAMVKVAAPPEPDATVSEPEETSSEG